MLFGYAAPMSFAKVRIKPDNLLRMSFSFGFYVFALHRLYFAAKGGLDRGLGPPLCILRIVLRKHCFYRTFVAINPS